MSSSLSPMRAGSAEISPVFQALMERLNALIGSDLHVKVAENLAQAFQRCKAGAEHVEIFAMLLDGLIDCLDSRDGFVASICPVGDSVFLCPQAVRGDHWPREQLCLSLPASATPISRLLLQVWDGGEPISQAERREGEAMLCAPVIRKGSVIGMVGLSGRADAYGIDCEEVLQLYRLAFSALLAADRSQPAPEPVVRDAARHLLVVEDNPANQAIIELQCSNLGCTADLCGDAERAFERWQAQRHAVVLIDKNLPGMDGTALIRLIRGCEREDGGHTCLVAITAEQNEQELECLLEAGADEVLCKPISIENLAEVLTRRGIILPADLSAEAPLPVLDLTQIACSTGSSGSDQLIGLARLFLSTARTELVHCGRSLSLLDRRLVGLSMHKLKSSARSVGAMRFARLAENFERQAPQAPIESLEATLYELQHALDEIDQALAQQQAGIAPERVGLPLPENPLGVQRDIHCALIVDDDIVASHFAAAMLSALGVEDVKVASSGEAALALLERYRWQVDLVMTDLRMPYFDGIEFIRVLAEKSFGGKLAIGSGLEESMVHSAADFAAASALNYCGFIRKPFSFKALSRLLNKASQTASKGPTGEKEYKVEAGEILAGMRNDEFDVYLQPIVDAHSLETHTLEALARWHGEHGFIPIESVIAAAERHGIMNQLSELLFTKALICGAMLAREGFNLRLAINVSSSWLSDARLPEFMLASCKATGFPVENIVLELTETGATANMAQALEVLTRLRLHGFRLSIDDFGAGYSSLERLQRIPFSELKIDRSFVRKAAEYEQSRTVLAYSLEMARQLNLDTVAEGVETERDLQLVRDLGCDSVQGWIVARPMRLAETLEWLRTSRR
jgi:EAL domain-containing protein (putative c-di-GMP-specific phosphodiesterase class I)/DNA-binding NarL/FixJ family response regulator/HPt (histidine-containing phosphotransfer) domain-containing protein